MGEMVSIKVLTALIRDHELPEGAKITWDEKDEKKVDKAERIFREYLEEGWLAFSESKEERKQVFSFDPSLPRIILVPPLGGG